MGINILECGAEKCVHNMNNKCSAQYITVASHKKQEKVVTNCKTFEPKEYMCEINNMTNVNIPGAIDQIFTEEPVMNPNVRCGVAECIYNSDYSCLTNDLTIGDYGSESIFETKCRSYKKK